MKCVVRRFNAATVTCVIFILICSRSLVVNSAPSGGDAYGTYDDDDRVTSHIVSNHTRFDSPYQAYNEERIFSRVLSLNDSASADILGQFNMSREHIDMLKARQMQGQATTAPPSVNIHNPSYDNSGSVDQQALNKEEMVNRYRETLSQVLRSTSPPMYDDETRNIMAFYPVCSRNNETSWLADNTAKLYFSSTMLIKINETTHLHNAVLRMRQVDPAQQNTPISFGCSEPEDLIHVSVSVMVRRIINGGNNRSANYRRTNSRRDTKLKKHVCETFTTPRHHTGWIRIDVRNVVRHWAKAYHSNSSKYSVINDPMLAIDVVDQDMNPLKAGTFFVPTNCEYQQFRGASTSTMTYGIQIQYSACQIIHG